MSYTLTALILAYLAVAVAVYRWLAPRSRTWRMDHFTAACEGLIWPALLVWIALALLAATVIDRMLKPAQED